MKLCGIDTCTGCAACVNVCPQNCIELNWGTEWVDYPKIDGLHCIECGKCVKACPVLSKPIKLERLLSPKFYAGALKDAPNDLRHSSSGGLAFALGKKVIQTGGTAYGAAYDENICVRHIAATSVKELTRTQGSKYVQSDIGLCYRRIKQQLTANKQVLFVGLPCQVAGLYQFLGCDYVNLITVDLLCGGSTSPKVFDLYLNYVKRKFHVELSDYNFRSKRYGTGYLCTTTTTTGKEIVLSGAAGSFITMLGAGYGRKACFSCKYTNMKRMGDITLGDCWGSKSKLNAEGISFVMINSKKGENAFLTLGDDIVLDESVPVSEIAKGIGVLHSPKKQRSDYEQIFSDLDKMDWKQIHKKYVLGNMNMKDKVLISCPMRIRIAISNAYGKIKKHVKK